MKYQPKTQKFEAVQFTTKNFEKAKALADGKLSMTFLTVGEITTIPALRITINDWLCRSSEGLLFILPNAHFTDKYEPVDDMTDFERLGQALLTPTEIGEPHAASEVIQRLEDQGVLLSCFAQLQHEEVNEVLRLLGRADLNISTATLDGLIDMYWKDIDASHHAQRSLSFRVLEGHKYRVDDIKKVAEEAPEPNDWLRSYIRQA